MQREKLVNYKGLLLSEDTAQAMDLLYQKIEEIGNWTLLLTGPASEKADVQEDASLIPAGREVWLKLHNKYEGSPQSDLNALWGLAVPLRFTPLSRYPIADLPSRYVFHYLGPWQPLYDRLLAEGRGHLAWPSVCAAAQVDAGRWKGTRGTERFIQAQLHRIGRNCGAIDGYIGPRTLGALESFGVKRVEVDKLAEELKGMNPPQEAEGSPTNGNLSIPNWELVISTHGGIKVVRSPVGAFFRIDAPGRIVADVIGEKK